MIAILCFVAGFISGGVAAASLMIYMIFYRKDQP